MTTSTRRSWAFASAWTFASGAIAALAVGLGAAGHAANIPASKAAVNPDRLLVVDCLLPGVVRQLGGQMTYLGPRRPTRATANECEVRGGEYVAYDRANFATSLQVWLPKAQSGDAQAQTYVGEIFEKGMGQPADPAQAAQWYQRAADQGYAQAQSNLAYLYEKGLGVGPDPVKALNLYRQSAGINGDSLTFASEVTAVRDAAQGRIDEAQGRIDALSAQLERQTRDAQDLRAQLQGSQEQLQQRRAALATARHETDALRRRLADARQADPARSAELAAKVRQLESDLKTREAQMAQQQSEVGELEKSSRERSAALESQLAAANAQDEVLRQQLDAQKKSLLAMSAGSATRSTEPTEAPLRAPAGPMKVPDGLVLGNYYALIVGNNSYQYLPGLETAVNDARAVDKVLREHYGFKTRVLENATRGEMLSALNEYRASLQDTDNLLIYYAGHGELDAKNLRGYWLPVNARRDDATEWISDQMITDQIGLMAARHILVVADSCYSGSMTRSSGIRLVSSGGDAAELKRLTTLARLPSRTVLTSGGEMPVLDGGGGSNSIFAHALIDILDRNERVLEGSALWNQIFDPVRRGAAQYKVEQSPRYSMLPDAGHMNGEFLFVPRKG
jgi:hypothetical protein